MAAILVLGFASGLPLNLTGSGFSLQAWLASAKVDIKTIGIFSLVGLPYVFKFLWAPLLDRYRPPVLGRRRGWILIFQLGTAIALAAMAFGSPAGAPFTLAMLALLVAFLSASQDIVIDAYRADVVRIDERGLAAAATTFGYRTAAMLASAGVGLVAASTGWRSAYLLIAGMMSLTVFATLWSPEPTTPGRPPRTLANAVVHPFLDLMRHEGAWGLLLLVFLYKFGDAFALSLYSAFMIKGVGFSLIQLSIAGKVNMTISSMIGAALGGWLYLRWGLYRSLLTFGIAQAATNLLYMWLALAGKKIWLLVLATSVDNLAGGMGQAAFVAFLMAQCSVDFSATQYALLSALASIPRVTVGALAGHVVASVGWATFFVVTFASAMPGIALLVFLRDRIRNIEQRETTDAAAATAR